VEYRLETNPGLSLHDDRQIAHTHGRRCLWAYPLRANLWLFNKIWVTYLEHHLDWIAQRLP
jgi:hypothetical protein